MECLASSLTHSGLNSHYLAVLSLMSPSSKCIHTLSSWGCKILPPFLNIIFPCIHFSIFDLSVSRWHSIGKMYHKNLLNHHPIKRNFRSFQLLVEHMVLSCSVPQFLSDRILQSGITGVWGRHIPVAHLQCCCIHAVD